MINIRMLTQCTRALVESMTTSGNSEVRRDAYAAVTSSILAVVTSIFLIAFLGQWLWNNVIIELFTFAKPSRSIWMLIGLKFFLVLIMP